MMMQIDINTIQEIRSYFNEDIVNPLAIQGLLSSEQREIIDVVSNIPDLLSDLLSEVERLTSELETAKAAMKRIVEGDPCRHCKLKSFEICGKLDSYGLGCKDGFEWNGSVVNE